MPFFVVDPEETPYECPRPGGAAEGMSDSHRLKPCEVFRRRTYGGIARHCGPSVVQSTSGGTLRSNT